MFFPKYFEKNTSKKLLIGSNKLSYIIKENEEGVPFLLPININNNESKKPSESQ